MFTYNNHTTKTMIRFYLNRKYTYCPCKPQLQHITLLVQLLINVSGERVRQRQRERKREKERERDRERERDKETEK